MAPQKKEGTLSILDEDDSPPSHIRSVSSIVKWHHSNKTNDVSIEGGQMKVNTGGG